MYVGVSGVQERRQCVRIVTVFECVIECEGVCNFSPE